MIQVMLICLEKDTRRRKVSLKTIPRFICVCLNAVSENGYQAHKNERDIPSYSSGLVFHSLPQVEKGEKEGGSGKNKVETKAPILLKEKWGEGDVKQVAKVGH